MSPAHHHPPSGSVLYGQVKTYPSIWQIFIEHIRFPRYGDEIVVKVLMASDFWEPMFSERREATAKNRKTQLWEMLGREQRQLRQRNNVQSGAEPRIIGWGGEGRPCSEGGPWSLTMINWEEHGVGWQRRKGGPEKDNRSFRYLLLHDKVTLSGLKWQCIISCHSSVGWLGFTGCQFSLGIFLAIVVRWHLGLESSEGSNGLNAQDSFFTYMSGVWVGLTRIAGGWLSMLSLHVTSPIWLAWASSQHGGLDFLIYGG